MTIRPVHSLIIALAAFSIACKGDKGGASSYCEAACDLAVECAAAQREVDAATLKEECLTAAKAAGQCNEGNIADEKVNQPCIDDLAERQDAGECDAFTGNVAEATADVGPASCLGLDGFPDAWDAVQESTTESGAEMCERFTSDFCEKLTDCVSNTTGYDPNTLDTTPYDVCMSALEGRTNECIDGESFDNGDGVNTQRETATECLSKMDSDVTCDDLFAGRIPGICAGAFVNADSAAAFATDLAGAAGQFATGG